MNTFDGGIDAQVAVTTAEDLGSKGLHGGTPYHLGNGFPIPRVDSRSYGQSEVVVGIRLEGICW